MTVRYRNLLSHRTGGNIIDFANGINKKRCRATNFVAHDRTTAETLGLWPAIVLKRLQYWQNLGKGGQMHEGIKYIFKSAKELSQEIGCDARTVQRATTSTTTTHAVMERPVAGRASVGCYTHDATRHSAPSSHSTERDSSS